MPFVPSALAPTARCATCLCLGGWRGTLLSLPLQLAFLVPGIIRPLYLLQVSFMEELPLGLTDVIYHKGCDDDPGHVVFCDLEVGGDGRKQEYSYFTNSYTSDLVFS